MGPTVQAEAAAVRRGERSALETVDAALARIAADDARIGAWCDVRPEVARAAARAVDDRIRAGDDPGPLAGVPLAVKDLEDAAGYRTTAGDPARAGVPPAVRDSIQVARLRAAGAVVVGKTNTPPYGFTAETDNLAFGPTRNPWAPTRTAGGSSGGSAAALAVGMVSLATGSDGGGSIRIPAEVCGLPGFKPTNGLIPAGDDAPPPWGPLSTRGPMARTLGEVALALDVARGASARDLHSVEVGGSFVDAHREASLDGVRIGWSATLGFAEPAPAVVQTCEAAVRALEAHGARVEVVDAVFGRDPAIAWSLIAAPGCLDVVGRDPDSWVDRFSESQTALARWALDVDAAGVLTGHAGAHRAGLELAAAFDGIDILACPGMLAPPPRIGAPSPYGPGWAGAMTLPFNLTRTPAAVVPAGTIDDDGDELPVGLQLVAPRLCDLRLMRMAAAAEAVLPTLVPAGRGGAGQPEARARQSDR